MTGAAFVLGYLLAHPGLLIAYACVSAVTTVALLYYTIDDGHGRHALTAEDAATIEWARELHHEGSEWWRDEGPGNVVPAFLPAPLAENEYVSVGYPASLLDRYGPISEPGIPQVPAAAGRSGPPPPVLRSPCAIALDILAAFIAPVRAHLEHAERAKADALAAEALAVFPPWDRWPGDDTLTSMRAIKTGA